jgi:glycosyltransferase involved in cell wall biosynthesis
MIVHSYYDEDPRVRREAESLVAACRPVHVLGLRRPDDEPDGTVDGVRVQRLNVQRHQGSGLSTYLREYLTFLARSGWAAVRAHRRERFALVQVHSLPDFLVFAALPLRMVGVPVILDLHEAMPEFFRTRFARAANRVTHRLLLLEERVSIAFSTAVLTVNEAAADRLLGLGVPPAKVSIVRNSPALGRFDAAAQPDRPFAADGIVRLVYTGALTPIYEVDVTLRAMALIRERRPDIDVRLDVYGRGDSEPDLRAQATGLGLADRVAFHGRIPLDDVPRAIAAADIGLAPTRLDRYTEMTLSTKVFEYAAMGKPVVASRLPMVERTFPAGSVATYRPGDAEAMAAAILGFIGDPARRDDAVERARAIVLATAWEREAERYVALVDRFALDRP